jgi:hypothetical protein
MAKQKYNSLEDFLVSQPLSVDGQLDDGWGAMFPVKGREIEATILFADITGFSARTQDLSSTETLIFVNNFFAWITAEALGGGHGLVDKYIGDEMMVVFSKEFGSEEPFVEAIQTARFMAEQDAWSFCPHMGIASGNVTVGYVGTPIKYNCSVFGSPVALAARCASVKPKLNDDKFTSSFIVFPSAEWNNRNFDTVFPSRKYEYAGKVQAIPNSWKMLPPRLENLKNMGDVKIQEIVKKTIHIPTQSAEERAKENLEWLAKNGYYKDYRKT